MNQQTGVKRNARSNEPELSRQPVALHQQRNRSVSHGSSADLQPQSVSSWLGAVWCMLIHAHRRDRGESIAP